MVSSFTAALTAAVVFALTDVDDLVLLIAFFADPRLRARAVVGGQYLGIAALTAVSALAAWAAIAIPPGWTALLGAIPLALGLFHLWKLRGGVDDDHDEPADAERLMETRMHSQVLGVAVVTVANGADNLSVYIPMFAADISWLPLYVATFAVMTALWCALAWRLVRNRALGALLQRWGHLLLPVVLIALGLNILWGARVLMA